MSAITFTIQNPKAANEAVVYLGESNTLEFVFAGISTSIQPGDEFTVKIPGGLVSALSTNNFNTPGWKVTSFTPPGAGNIFNTFVLSPQQAIQAKNPLTLTFSDIQASKATNDLVTVNCIVGGRNLPGVRAKLAAMAPPNQTHDLYDHITFQAYINDDNSADIKTGQVYISPVTIDENVEKVLLPISNKIKINLKYNGSSELINDWNAAQKPKFIFSFSYGNTATDLTDALQSNATGYNPLTSAWNIQTALWATGAESGQWTDPQKSMGTDAPNWTVSPQLANQHLFSQDEPNLDVVFEHIISILPPGHATLYIQWSNIPGFNDGIKALNIVKAAPAAPKVISFSGPDGQKSIELSSLSDPLRLQWNTFGATRVTLFWTDGNKESASFPISPEAGSAPQLTYSGKINGDIVPVKESLSFYLTAYDDKGTHSVQAGPVNVKVTRFEGPVIESFENKIVNSPAGYTLQLTVKVRNAVQDTYAQVEGDDQEYPVPCPGGGPFELKIPLTVEKPLQPTYTLTVTDRFAGLSAQKTIETVVPEELKPVITVMKSDVEHDATTGAAKFSVDFQTSYLGLRGYVKINGGPEINHVKGEGQYNIDLSAEAPLKPFYRVEACNPYLQLSATVLLKVNYLVPHDFMGAEYLLTETHSCGFHLVRTEENDNCFLLLQCANNEIKVAYFNTKTLSEDSHLPAILLGISTYNGPDDIGKQFIGMSKGSDGNIYVNTRLSEPVWSNYTPNLAWFNPNNLPNPEVSRTAMGRNAKRGVIRVGDNFYGYFNYANDYLWQAYDLGHNFSGYLYDDLNARAIAGAGSSFYLLNDDGKIVGAPGVPLRHKVVAETGLRDPITDKPTAVYKRMHLASGRYFYVVGDDTYLAYFDLEQPGLQKIQTGVKANNVTVSDDRSLIFIVDMDQNLHVFSSVETGGRHLQTMKINLSNVTDVAVSADNTRIFISTFSNSFVLVSSALLAKAED